MGRMHTPGKGSSQSSLPYIRSAPSWLKNNFSSADVVDLIVKNAKKGLTPSKIGAPLVKPSAMYPWTDIATNINTFVLHVNNEFRVFIVGVLLRDTKGIGQSKAITGNKILRILRSKGTNQHVLLDLECIGIAFIQPFHIRKREHECEYA
jgi:small subunit ribosomal protein S13e